MNMKKDFIFQSPQFLHSWEIKKYTCEEDSGYQVNQSKFKVIMLKGQLPTKLLEHLENCWSYHGFTYFGIVINFTAVQL